MDKNLKMLPVSKIFLDVYYDVPIYQRNYAWEELQIEQLIEDIDTAGENYFLGNLIVNQKDSNLYEVIDGQQRLTTLYLLERYLGIAFPKDALRFEAREKSNRTLAIIGLPNHELIEELKSVEIINGYQIIENYFKKSKIDKANFVKKLDNIKLIRVQVPKKIDLNHYFEIMNTRGEQLELHEIAKARILGVLTSPEDKKLAATIWENCSNMDSYVQMNFDSRDRNQIFTSTWTDLADEVCNFESLKKILNNSTEVVKQHTLLDILSNKNRVEDTKKIGETENERFESIISFPNFLLQVNAALTNNIDEDSSLDDKRFLYNLQKNWASESASQKFIYAMLKCRVLFDKYILKREYARDYKESGKWSLQRLEKYTDKHGDKPKYLGTFGGDEDQKNKQIRTLQSALRITYTSPKTMHWIPHLLANLLKEKDVDILELLEKFAQVKVNESNYKTASGFGFERIVFTYLDYLLYKEGYSYNNISIIKPLADDWQFQFRSSIEHFYPQHPTELKAWDDKDLNSFGNLALITVSGNSTFNNAMPVGKANTNPGIIKQSLKLMVMAEMMKMNDNQWTEEIAHKHQDEMFGLLSKVII